VNEYLRRAREEFTSLRSATTTLLDSAAAGDGRDLTADELATVEQNRARADALAATIESLAQDELRAQQVAATVAGIHDATPAATPVALASEHTRGAVELTTSSTTAVDRDPGHYRSEREGGTRSFFADAYRARFEDDDAAKTRLDEHTRALSTGVAGAGLVLPKWLSDRYEGMLRFGRGAANAVTNISLGGDPRPMTIPSQTGGTDAAVAEQSTENTHPGETDGFATGGDVITPKPTSGIQVFSRQMLDMATPAIDQLIYADLAAVYNNKVETKVITAIATAAVAATGSPLATEAAFATGQVPSNMVIQAAMDVWDNRFAPADLVLMNVRRWAVFNKLRDSTGRPLYPASLGGERVNIDGVGSVTAAGSIEGLPVVVTKGIPNTYAENIYVLRASDVLLFEGDMMRFRFEEVAGPESIKVGIWAYTAVSVRRPTASVRKITVTAAS
jgi:HK97 family phage major capsid protein